MPYIIASACLTRSRSISEIHQGWAHHDEPIRISPSLIVSRQRSLTHSHSRSVPLSPSPTHTCARAHTHIHVHAAGSLHTACVASFACEWGGPSAGPARTHSSCIQLCTDASSCGRIGGEPQAVVKAAVAQLDQVACVGKHPNKPSPLTTTTIAVASEEGMSYRRQRYACNARCQGHPNTQTAWHTTAQQARNANFRKKEIKIQKEGSEQPSNPPPNSRLHFFAHQLNRGCHC